MRKLYKISIIILTFILFCIIIFSVSYSKKMDSSLLGNENSLLSYQKVPKYHFYAIFHNSDEPYLTDMLKGLKETAATWKAAVEINHTSDVDDYQDTLRLLNIAISSRVDGIITHAYNTPDFIKLMEEADKKSIPIITLDEGVPQTKSSAYVGMNGFEMGSKAGKLAGQAMRGNARVAMILDDIKGYGNVKVEGFKDAIKDYNDMKIEAIKVSELGILGANNVTQEILARYRNVNTIVCTTSKDTIGVAQLIIDLNRVGDVTIIGCGMTPEISKYIDNGVIYGTIVPNAYSIGSNSIKLLVDLKQSGRASTFFDTDINVITRNNLEEYLKHNSIEGGKANK